MRKTASLLFRILQERICSELESLDSKKFCIDEWERTEAKNLYGGGGISSVLKNGTIFEQAGVNFSAVEGTLPISMVAKLLGKEEPQPFFATGISLVLHPQSPMIPITHANFRYLEVGDQHWFGGGADLTPTYFFEEDAKHFHQTLKTTCDCFDTDFYPCFKEWCDQYFYLPHRGETRGIGGIFFDYLGRQITTADDKESTPTRIELSQRYPMKRLFSFIQEIGDSFIPAYIPIVERRKILPFGERERAFQLYRRGRYVEFNLLYDRGTQFGLHTGGRVESILMSLPPFARWEYQACFDKDSFEAKLIEVLKEPRDWA